MKIQKKIVISIIITLVVLSAYSLFSSNDDSKYEDKNLKKEKNSSTSTIQDFVYASEKSINAVVHIKSKIIQDELYRYYDPFYDFFYGDGYRYFNNPKEKFASGSGVIISNDGYIITNNHVINEANQIEVVLNDKRIYTANILGVDPTTDLALLKIDETDLTHLDFADSDKSKVGEWVIAVGNPFNLNSTVTAGIISAKGRNINLLNNPHAIESFIQTDAAINSGNSGGALVSIKGELLGINTAIQSRTGSYSGYGFAIPSNIVKKVVSDLKKYGQVKRAFIGIQISEITSKLAHQRNLKNGVLITKVFDGGAAKNAGIKNLDILLTINDFTIESVSSLQEQIAKYSPGDKINCSINRNGKLLRFSLDLSN